MVRGARRYPLAELNVKRINLGCLKLLQWPLAQRRHDVTAERFGVALDRTSPNLAAPLIPRSADGNPMIDPLSQRHFVGRYMLAGVASVQQIPKRLLRL